MFTLEEVVASCLYDNLLVEEKQLMDDLRKKFLAMENPPQVTLTDEYKINEVVSFLRHLVHCGTLHCQDIFGLDVYFIVQDKPSLEYYFKEENDSE